MKEQTAVLQLVLHHSSYGKNARMKENKTSQE